MTGRRRLALLVGLVTLLPAAIPSFALDAAPSASPTPAKLSAHDRLVQQIAKLDRYLLDPRVPADRRRRLTEARARLDAQRLKLEAPPAASPR
jgi:hypothetical protein